MPLCLPTEKSDEFGTLRVARPISVTGMKAGSRASASGKIHNAAAVVLQSMMTDVE